MAAVAVTVPNTAQAVQIRIVMSDIFTDVEYQKIGKYLVEHGAWQRHEQDRKDESYSILGIKLPYNVNLASKGSRVDGVLREIEKVE